MTEDPRIHWQTVHGARAPTEVSWYEPLPARSLDLIRATAVAPAAPIIDVGGGAATLVDHLLAAGFSDVTVLDIAPAALETARARLGAAAARVSWIAADITQWRPERRYDLWHDRAVFHFLVDAPSRERYLGVLRAALAPGGHLVLATFGPEGPTRCSGLPVQRYAAAEVSDLLGPAFRLQRSTLESHTTPAGNMQQFLYGWWRAEA